jgi:hypothetical protein
VTRQNIVPKTFEGQQFKIKKSKSSCKILKFH